MSPKKITALFGLLAAAAATTPAYAQPTKDCNVVLQTIIDNKGVKHDEPIVACKDKKNVWALRPVQNFMTVGEYGPNKDDKITTGYSVSDKGEVTTFFIDNKSKSVEVGTCKSVIEDFRFWTSSKDNVLILRDLLTESVALEGRSEIYGNNLTTALLKAQNGAMMECILKGHIPPAKEEPKSQSTPESGRTPDLTVPTWQLPQKLEL